MNKKVLTSLLVAVFLVGTLAAALTAAEVTITDKYGDEVSVLENGDNFYVKVVDEDANTDVNAREIVEVRITTHGGSTSSNHKLLETDDDTGVFMSSGVTTDYGYGTPSGIAVVTVQNLDGGIDGPTQSIINTAGGDAPKAEYDANNPTSFSSATASTTASVDPVIDFYGENTGTLNTGTVVGPWNAPVTANNYFDPLNTPIVDFEVQDLSADTDDSADSDTVTVTIAGTDYDLGETGTVGVFQLSDDTDTGHGSKLSLDFADGSDDLNYDFGGGFQATYNTDYTSTANVGLPIRAYDDTTAGGGDDDDVGDQDEFQHSYLLFKAIMENDPLGYGFIYDLYEVTDGYDATAGDGESFPIYIKDYTESSGTRIQAEGTDEPVISANEQDVGAVFYAQEENVTLKGLTVKNEGNDTAGMPRGIIADSIASGLTIEDTVVDGVDGETSGTARAYGMYLEGNDTEVVDSEVKNVYGTNYAAGIKLNNLDGGGTIDNVEVSNVETLEGTTEGAIGIMLIDIGGDATEDTVVVKSSSVTGVTVPDEADGTGAFGIIIYGSSDPYIDIRYNEVTGLEFDNVDGYGILFPGNVGISSLANVSVEYNDLSGNDYGIGNGVSGETLTAQYNWFGSTTGPDVASNDDGTGSKVGSSGEGSITYRPWLNAAPTADYDDNTVAGNKTVTLDDVSEGTTKYYWTVSDALNSAGAGDTITVDDGTYAETGLPLSVGVDLTIEAASSPVIEAAADTTIVSVGSETDLTWDGIGLKYDTAAFDATDDGVNSDVFIHNGDLLTLKNATVNAVADHPTDSLVNSDEAALLVDGSADNTVVTLEKANFKNATNGIELASGGLSSLSGTDLEVKDNSSDGILVTGSTATSVAVNESIISGNTDYGVNNDTDAFVVDATKNWWGAEDGPSSDGGSYNNPGPEPTGSGNQITDYVSYKPYYIDEALSNLSNTSTFATVFENPDTGWMLISYPNEAVDNTANLVFGEFSGKTLYNMWGGEDYLEVPIDSENTVTSTEGYWLYTSGNNDVTVEGYEVEEDVEFTFAEKGWYMISTPYATYWSSGIVSSSGLDDDGADNERIVAWNLEESKYENYYSGVQTLKLSPWKGYWVKATEEGASLTIKKADMPEAPDAAAAAVPASTMEPGGLDAPPAPPSMSLDLASLEVMAAPNPASSSDMVTFKVTSGPAFAVSGMDVQVFSATGSQVFTGNSAGSSLTWDPQGVSNGLYLYTVKAHTSAGVISSGVQKLLLVK